MNAKRIFVCLALIGLMAVSGQAVAEYGTIDNVPAATLLLPYFEVAPDKTIDTLFSVNNASAAPALAHVTVWTDQSIPVLDFDVYLTGYDVQSFSLYSMPDRGQAAHDRLQRQQRGPVLAGQHQHLIIPGLGTCGDGQAGNGPPYYGPLSGTFLSVIQAALTGQTIPAGSAAGLCAGADYGDGILRGYVTVDSVSECSQAFPTTAGYFVNGGIGIANNANVLWGDWFLVDEANNFASGETLIHIEADDAFAACDPADGEPWTFYCRYTGGTGVDDREALPSTWGTRYLQGGAFDGGTALIVWRDPADGSNSPGSCGSRPFEYSLTQNQIVVFDEEENPIVSQRGPSGFEPADENPFLYETQRVFVGGSQGPTVAEPFGWIYLNLNGALGDRSIHNQAWVHTILSALGRFSVGYDDIMFNNLSNGGRELRRLERQRLPGLQRLDLPLRLRGDH